MKPAHVHLLGAALCLGYIAVLLATAPAIGLSRDESIYVGAAQTYAGWFELLWSDPSAALQQANIDRAFRINSEHPPLIKTLFALSYLLDREVSLFTRASLPFRFVGMLSAGLLLWLILAMGTRLWNLRVGLFAACAYALLPRPFYHAHLCAFDVPIALLVTAVSYAYLRSLGERRAYGRSVILTGLLFGLALATKHNSWVLPGIYALHFALVLLLARLYRTRSGEHVSEAARPVPAVPYWFLAMAILGPLVFLGTWPWLWNDTLRRIAGYAAFHLHHDYYNIEYLGENHFWPPFPVSYPWVMTLYTVPLSLLALVLSGLVLRGKVVLADVRAALAGRAPSDSRLSDVLLLGCGLAPLVIIALPSTPIFGGTKHWFTGYPFLMLFAGVAFDAIARALSLALAKRSAGPTPQTTRVIALAVGALMLAPAAVETAHSHPFGLSHYTMAAGFVPGAADRGMNRQFWGFTTGSLVNYFNERVPDGSRVYVCDTTLGAFRMLAEDGHISARIRPTLDLAQSDFALVHHEKHMAEVDFQIWSAYGTTQPDHVLTYDGVPIVSVYRRPATIK